VRNAETPFGVRTLWVRSADREESSTPRREQDDQKANAGGRKAAGNHDGSISALLLMVVDNRPDTGPCARARKRADVVRWTPKTTMMTTPEPTDKLDAATTVAVSGPADDPISLTGGDRTASRDQT
jgi:hypothetical protein